MSEAMSDRAGEARLVTVIEAYGADPARWPAEDRARLERLGGATSPAVAEALRQARALDRLLADDAAVLAPGMPALAARIKAAAQAGRAAESRTAADNVVIFRRPAPKITVPPPSRVRRGAWQAAAAMAASLVLGVAVGASGITQPLVDAVAEAAGLSSDEEPLMTALRPASFGLAEEEQL